MITIGVLQSPDAGERSALDGGSCGVGVAVGPGVLVATGVIVGVAVAPSGRNALKPEVMHGRRPSAKNVHWWKASTVGDDRPRPDEAERAEAFGHRAWVERPGQAHGLHVVVALRRDGDLDAHADVRPARHEPHLFVAEAADVD